ncbi:site-2 protease family protein [Patescibacteria group bacterium]|nr:site-2 protease family protein [Patescibacteria group bacterium]
MDIIIFLVALSILVLVHELGHFMAAKFTGVKVEEFGLGLPPRIFGKKIGETVFSLNWLPIGGFCKLYGEDPTEAAAIKSGSKRTFFAKNPWQKLLIVVGGVVMNMVLAVVVFSVVYEITGIPTETQRVTIVEVAKGSPAEKAGLKTNDVITKVEGVTVHQPTEVTNEVAKYKGKNVQLIIANEQAKTEKEVTVPVRENPPAGEGALGVAISNTEMVKVPWWQFYKGIGAGFKEAYFWGKIIVDGVAQMVSTLASGRIPKDVAGPIGMYQATTSIRQAGGLLAVFHFFAIVSVNLAVVNILPFPALDGGRIIFVLYEFIFRKRANEKFEAMVNNVGMMILLGLVLLITVGDITRIIKK